MKSLPDDQLLASYLSGECSEEELREVELWLQSNPEYRETMDDIAKAWTPGIRRPNLWDKNKLWLKIRDAAGVQQLPTPGESQFPLSSTARQSRLVLVMASGLLAISLGLFSFLVTSDSLLHGTPTTLKVQHGAQEKLTLSDGTVVTLDAGSSFSYPIRFKAKTREVSLYGEGYFEVAPDASKPFIIRTDHAVVQVLGTKFTVRSWELDRAVRVAVAEGRVSLRPARGRGIDAMIITGGQAAAVLENGMIQSPHDVDPAKYLAWLDHDLGFDNVSLEEILFHLERWYDVKFTLASSVLASERLTLHTQKKSIDSILEMITLLTDLNYERSDSIIHLSASE
ncbi:FecR domain-containing protein [Candidatus Neomarinimicrobiota bacterium]